MYKKIFSLIVLTATLGCLLLPPSLFADEAIKVRIVAARAPIRQAAALTAPLVATADKGQVFDVIEKVGKWYLVQLPSGAVGYVHQLVVEEVAETVNPSVTPSAQVPKVRIVRTRQAPIRQAAAMTALVVATADKGQVFDVIEKVGKWYLVQLPSGAKGFLHQSIVEEVAETVNPSVTSPVQVPVVTERPRTQAPTIARQPAPKGDTFSMFLGRFGYFLASDSAFKEIYGNGAVYGGELRLGGKRIVGWLEGSYRERVGKFSFTGEETKVKVTGIEVGALCRIIPGNISPYAGAGIGYFMFNENNVAVGEAKQSKIGFCGLAGVSMIIGRSFVLDARVKFSTCAMKPADFDINVGGITLGIGAGFRF